MSLAFKWLPTTEKTFREVMKREKRAGRRESDQRRIYESSVRLNPSIFGRAQSSVPVGASSPKHCHHPSLSHLLTPKLIAFSTRHTLKHPHPKNPRSLSPKEHALPLLRPTTIVRSIRVRVRSSSLIHLRKIERPAQTSKHMSVPNGTHTAAADAAAVKLIITVPLSLPLGHSSPKANFWASVLVEHRTPSKADRDSLHLAQSAAQGVVVCRRHSRFREDITRSDTHSHTNQALHILPHSLHRRQAQRGE